MENAWKFVPTIIMSLEVAARNATMIAKNV